MKIKRGKQTCTKISNHYSLTVLEIKVEIKATNVDCERFDEVTGTTTRPLRDEIPGIMSFRR